jgi:hypothetical protein
VTSVTVCDLERKVFVQPSLCLLQYCVDAVYPYIHAKAGNSCGGLLTIIQPQMRHSTLQVDPPSILRLPYLKHDLYANKQR